MVAKVPINAKITPELKQTAMKDAKKRGITLSRYIETALIHELNRKTNDGTIHELENLKNIINDRIEELQIQNPEECEGYVDENLENAVHDIDYLQRTCGYVTEGVVQRNAQMAGLTFQEFLDVLKEYGIEIVIMK